MITNTGEASDEYTKKIDSVVVSSRKHKSWRNEYMKYEADREDLIDIGIQQGLAQGLAQGREHLINVLIDLYNEQVIDIHQAASKANITEEEFIKFINAR